MSSDGTRRENDEDHTEPNDAIETFEPLPYAGESDSDTTGGTSLLLPAPRERPDAGDDAGTTEYPPQKLMGSPMRRLVSPAELETGSNAGAIVPAAGETTGAIAFSNLLAGGDGPERVGIESVRPVPEAGQQIRKGTAHNDVERLAEEISRLYEQVTAELADSRHHADRALEWLNEARTILLSQPEDYPVAEMRVHQTRALLQQVAFSQAAGERNIGLLVSWNLAWLLFLSVLFALDGYIANALVIKGTIGPPPPNLPGELLNAPSLTWSFPPWLSVLAGGIGGALAALIMLARQKSRHEYDPADNLNFRLNPLKGAIWGGMVYYLLLGGFMVVAATSAVDLELGRAEKIQVANSPLFILIGFLVGLAQPRLLALLERVRARPAEQQSYGKEE